MEAEFNHRVLIVDDEARVAKAISRILEMEKIETVTVDSGNEGLKKIKSADKPFSLIIADQRMPGMKGTQFLEQAKSISPDTVRFLITGYSEMQTILHAVNKGSVQKYIAKPWEHDELLAAIQSGLRFYEQSQENERLLVLAKKQNKQLYDLNCELMELTTDHNKKLKALDAEIEVLKKNISETREKKQEEEKGEGNSSGPDLMAEDILNALGQTPDQDRFDLLFLHTLETLFRDFNDLAQRNGFEMPEPGPEDAEEQEDDGTDEPEKASHDDTEPEGLKQDE
ncbi:response regulator [Desulfospira joergensenii]|uniref:response regulator n=1 Tax=Desulfospira joergensenii TaxID=53329 RepID=UPI0003B53F2D|nr:response regulator [Desulfospira joergensenii]